MTASAPRFEILARHCALGFRCWDTLFDSAVVQGLIVTLRRKEGTGGWQHAVQTPNGHFSFHGLKGLHEYETTGKLLDQPLPFELYVEDSLGRFLPTLRVLDLPWTGEPPLLSSQTPAHLKQPARGLMLFSAPTRQLPAGVELIHGDLWDAVNRRPAAHAVLIAETGGVKHYTVADARGRIRMPLGGLASGLTQWDVQLTALYQGLSGSSSDENLPPCQAEILRQAAAELQPDVADSPVVSLQLTLHKDQPLVLETKNVPPDEPDRRAAHSLWIQPHVS